MTVSAHVYAARVMPANVPLPVLGGSISMDTSRIPHVDGSLRCPLTPDLLASLDPRVGARVSVTATRDGGTPRVFDLVVRSVRPDWAGGVADVDLTSDEALLEDYAPLVQDRTPRTFESSARAVTAYVLSKIGATLIPGSVDADLTAQWPLDNLATDPRCTSPASTTFGGATATLTATTGISSVLGTGATTCATATLTAQATNWAELRKTITVTPGQVYSLRVAGRWSLPGTTAGTRALTARAFWLDKDGNPLGEVAGPTVSVSDPGAGSSPWTWLTLTAVKAPAGATQVRAIMRVAGPLASGSVIEATAWMLVPADEVVPYFDGYTANDAVYAYTWTGDANLSTSHREPTIERDPDALVWQPGQSAMDFLQPLLKVNGIRLVCDETRTWSLRDEDYQHAGSSAWRWAVNLTELSDSISIDGDEGWFDAAVYTYRWTGRDGIARVRRDAYALNDPPRKVLQVELTTPWPGPGRAETMVRRAQNRGRVTTVAGVPTWTEHTDQPVQVTTQDGTVLSGAAATVTYSLDDDTVTITSRTTRIPPGSITLLTGTIDALVGTIDNL